MKHLLLVTVLLLVVSAQAVGAPAEDERELTQLIKDIDAAVVKGDVAFLERALHKDYVHTRARGTVETRAQYLDERKVDRRKTAGVDYESLSADDMKVLLYGDAAVAIGHTSAKGKDQQGAMAEQRRWTRVFVRQGGRWQLVAYQGTPVQKP